MYLSSTESAAPRAQRHLGLVSDLLSAQPTLNDDGRLNIDVDARALKTLSLLPNFKPPPPYSLEPTEPPPPFSHHQVFESDKKFPVGPNIVIQVVGSRGDVQPFVALGSELQKHGHRVRLATHNVFESFVRTTGLEFYPIGGDPAELMAYMVRNPGLIPSMQSLRAGDIKKKRVMMAEILRGCWESCISPDLNSGKPFVADAIIANPPSFAHVHCAQALSIPVHMMFTMPWTSTTAFAHPLVNINFNSLSGAEPSAANYLSYAVVEFLTWQGLGDIINEWRESIDLEQIAFTEGPRLLETLNVPFTYCWSPALVPKPRDWSSRIDVCGFFFREAPDYEPPANLADFLQSGPPPIYIGFGSIVIDDPISLSKMLLEAVRTTGVRAIISRGWSNLDGPESENTIFIGDCPHEWLFQHVTTVMHHGGAGTTACGLLNGRPTIIVPFFGDQPFWGNMVADAGAGPAPIAQKSLTVEKIAEAIRYCLTPEAATAAAEIATKMRCENGVKEAVASFHAQLPRQMLRCDVVPDHPAAWTYSHSKGRLKLSKMAAEILVSHLMIDPGRLKMHESHRIVIEPRRWDPFTGTVAAAWGVSVDLARAAADTVVKPAKELRKPTTDMNLKADSTDGGDSMQDRPPTRDNTRKNRGCSAAASSSASIAAGNMANLLKRVAGGAVSIPLAFTEGWRNMPKLYGANVRDYGEVRDWKSGAVIGGKATVFGIYDAITGVFILPYQGAMERGPKGALTGLGKGVISLQSNLFTAVMGMTTYPLQGMYKSLLYLSNSKTRHAIQLARHAEGRYLVEQRRSRGMSDKSVMNSFTELKDKMLPK